MTKRVSNSEEKTSKKQKLDDDIDELWGDDDLDDSILDDCINRATQVLNEKDQLNASLLPSYNVFKEPGQLFSSTQFDTSVRPGTSKTGVLKENVISYEKEIQRLQQQCEEKVGEISILRNQLSETKSHMNVEQQRSQNEWKSKLIMKDKQIQSMKSELEFKNLEIANLKQSQKIVDTSRYGLNATSNNSKIKASKSVIRRPEVEVIKDQPNPEKNKFHVITDSVYPLRKLMSKMVLNNPKLEKHVMKNKLSHSSRNAIPYLKNQTTSTSVVVEKSHVDIEIIHPAILELAECTIEELDMKENVTKINGVVCVSLQLLTDLEELLVRIRNNLGTEDILEADSNYVRKNFSETSCQSIGRDEVGLKSGILINFLNEILPHSQYLNGYFFDGKHLKLSEQDSRFEQLPYLSTRRTHTGSHYLNKLIEIAKLIGETRKAEAMTKFLRASLKMFTNICKLKKYECVSELVCCFTKELILLRPCPEIIYEMTSLFKEASPYTSFIEFLLNKAKSCSTTKKGVVYFNNDTCRFYIFVLMFDRCIYKSEKIPLGVSLNLLCFMYNTFKTSFFIHHQDTKECDCLPQLYKLEIEILFRALEQYKRFGKRNEVANEWDNFFKNKITVKMISLMAFHSYELVEKYITVYSQFKEIERQLQEENLLDLDMLNISEEMPEIDSKKFDNINFY